MHWRSTAKRRKLMVKELTETPRDEAAVLLDGERIRRSARAAQSQLRRPGAGRGVAAVTDGDARPALLAGASTARPASALRIQAGGGEWGAVMAALAAVEPDAERPLHVMLRDLIAGSGAAESVDAARLFVVTRGADAGARRPAARRSARHRRDVALVWVDAPDFAGADAEPRAGGGRVAAAGPGGRAGGPAAGRRRRRRRRSRPPPSPGSTRMRERLR